MSDVSKTNELIVALRERAVSDSPAHTLMNEAADALDRATRCSCPTGDGSLRWPCPKHPPTPTRVPVQGEPNDEADFRLARSRGYAALKAERDFTGHMDEGRRTAYYEGFKLGRKYPQGEPNDDREVLDNVLIDAREAGDGLSAVRNRILAAGFSRATVPDAALAAIAAARVVCLQLGGVDGDVSQPAPSYYVSVGRNVVATEVLAALDGAPEPEWEYSVVFNDPEDGWTNDGADTHDNYEDARNQFSEPYWMVEDLVVRRRKAGPWEPIKGESDD